MRTIIVERIGALRASYQDDWCEAIQKSPHFQTTTATLRPRNSLGSLRRQLQQADLIILMHSVLSGSAQELSRIAEPLNRRSNLLISFVGNEVNLPGASIAERRKILKIVQPDLIATQLLKEAGEYLWDGCYRTGVIALPHALNERIFRPAPATDIKSVDIGIRSFRYPMEIGDDDRNRLVDLFNSPAIQARLRCDVSSRRLSRADWANFLRQCRGTASNEAGSWFLRPDDSLVDQVQHAVQKSPRRHILRVEPWLRHVLRRLPIRLRKITIDGAMRFVPVETLASRDPQTMQRIAEVFNYAQRSPVYSKAISSRHFEAIGTRTCQILLKGRYNDLLTANKHYIPLSRDFSNLEEVLTAFADTDKVLNLVNSAYKHAHQSHLYHHRVADLAVEANKLRPIGRL